MLNNRIINKLLFLLAFAVMLARGFLFTGSMPVVHYALLAAKFAMLPVAVILALRTPGKPTSVDICMVLYGIAMYAACMINNTQILTITLMALDVFIFWALCRWFMVRRSLFPFKAITLILLAFIALNFLLMLWRPNGIWQYETNGKMYFLLGGNYNNMGKALFFAIVSNVLLLLHLPREMTRERRIYMAVLLCNIVLSFMTLKEVGSKTSLAGILLITGFSILLLMRGNTLRRIALVSLVAGYFILQSWAVFRDMDRPSPYTEHVVEDVLQKDMTFSLRTHLWARAKRLISRQPVIGYGEHDDTWYQYELEGLTTHNLVLHILLKGGWVCLTAFILLVIVIHIRLIRTRGPDCYFLLAALWTYLFMMIFEVYPFVSLSILFIYCSYSRALHPSDTTTS